MEQKKKETLGTVMAVCGGICWGFSGCCGQFLFETWDLPFMENEIWMY